MSVTSVSTGSEVTIPEEEEESFNIGMYIGERNALEERHGRGWAILPNGDQYDGQYRQGKRHGIGLYVFKGGARYYGRYSCGRRSGRGIFIYPDGSLYEGNWRKNVKHGKGRYQYANGDSYTGDWYRGIRHGVGIYTFNSEPNCCVRFKGTWREGKRMGPFEVYFGNSEKCTVLHGTWENLYPKGPAVFSFDQRYMLMGFFQQANANDQLYLMPSKKNLGHGEFENEELAAEEGEFEMLPSIWFAQDMCVYDYSQLPQEPVPLPLSDSDVSVCSLSTAPTEYSVGKSVHFICEDEEEAEGEAETEICECECSMSEIETESEPCTKPDPCAIDLKAIPKC